MRLAARVGAAGKSHYSASSASSTFVYLPRRGSRFVVGHAQQCQMALRPTQSGLARLLSATPCQQNRTQSRMVQTQQGSSSKYFTLYDDKSGAAARLSEQQRNMYRHISSVNPVPIEPRRSIGASTVALRHGGHGHDHDHGDGVDIFDISSIRADPRLTEREKRERATVVRVTWFGLWADLGLTGLKFFAGIAGNSSAMIAEAAHSAGDFVFDVVTMWALHASRRPSTDKHPYGFGRFETVGSLVVSGMLVATGLGIAHHSYEHLFDPEVPEALAAYVAAGSMVIKEALYRVTMKVADQQDSQLMRANAWHHRGDALSCVIAFAGIVGARMGIPFLDPLAGLLVAGLIVQMGAQIGWKSLGELTDSSGDPKTIQGVARAAMSIPGIHRAHGIRVRKMGHYLLADLNINVDPFITVSHSHQLSSRVSDAVRAANPRIKEVMCHVCVDDDAGYGAGHSSDPSPSTMSRACETMGDPASAETVAMNEARSSVAAHETEKVHDHDHKHLVSDEHMHDEHMHDEHNHDHDDEAPPDRGPAPNVVQTFVTGLLTGWQPTGAADSAIQKVAHVAVHYLPSSSNPSIHAEVTVQLDEKLTIRRARDVTRQARDYLLRQSREHQMAISSVDFHLEVDVWHPDHYGTTLNRASSSR